MLLNQMAQKRPDVQIEYRTCVTEQGNAAAQRRIAEVFQPCDAEWRGLGVLPGSGLALRPEWSALDAQAHFDLPLTTVPDPPGCACGNVLRGKLSPFDCRLFAEACTPAHPVGPCMVSSEGTCAAYFKYRRQ
jgi:hydrogenase expression/formation protein HypD